MSEIKSEIWKEAKNKKEKTENDSYRFISSAEGPETACAGLQWQV